MSRLSTLLALCLLFASCQNRTEHSAVTTTDSTVSSTAAANNRTDTNRAADTMSNKPQATTATKTYRLVTKRDSIRHAAKYFTELPVLLAVNRVDSAHITKLDTLVVPAVVNAPLPQYSPFPQSLPFLQNVRKMVYFSYPAQYFAAYENGRLVYTGPTNMGRQKDPTPTGLFFTNWKAEKTKSTFNDEWELKWNFNIDNKEGIGWHQYAMPGYPASHSCLRLQEADAKSLYDWADQWVMKGGKTVAQGTPVIVFGSYPFGGPKPWYRLATDAHALDITADQLQSETQPHMSDIMAEQQKQGNNAAKK